MKRTIEAEIDENGVVRFLEECPIKGRGRVLVTFLEDEGVHDLPSETEKLSEAALAQDWNRPEEDEAWRHLQEEQSS